MYWILFIIASLTYNAQKATTECTHENNYGVYFIYCNNLNSLDEINSQLYEENPIRIFINNSNLALKRSQIFKGLYLKELEVASSNVTSVEPSFLDSLQQLGKFTIIDSHVNKIETFPEINHLYYVKISGVTIPNVPVDLLQKLGGLYAATVNNLKSDLKHLPSDMLKNTPVQYLSLDNIGLESLNPDSLYTLRKLVSLSMANNNLKELPDKVFKDLVSLNELNLEGNKLTELNQDVFTGLNSLKELILSNNELSHIDSTWFVELSSVDLIDLHSNKIINLNIVAPSLKSLDLSNNRLIALQDELFSGVPSLSFLDLSYNSITDVLPDAFKNLHILEVLNLEGNKISKLKSNIYRHFSNFTCFVLSNNKISDLSAIEFDHLESLLSLNLSHNNIEKLPKNAFTKLYSLEELDLHNTLLTDIKPEMFYGLEHLQSLNLSNNQLQTIVPGAFKGLPALQILSLGNVKLTSIHSDVLMGLPKLKMLDLQYNAINNLPTELLKYSKLNIMSLRGNKILYLIPEVFVGQNEMEEFDIRSTDIESLEVVEELPNLRYLLLKDTKFENQNIISFKNSTFRKINEDYWDSWCPDFLPECRRD